MYKEKNGNIEIYFICYKGEEMDLIENYYDEILDIHEWYLNSFLAYKYWKNKFKNITLDDIAKMFLTIGASRYISYKIENNEYKNINEKNRLVKDLKSIKAKLKLVLNENKILLN